MNSNNQGGSRGRSKSKDLFTSWFSKKNNNSDGAIVSPLLDQDEQQNQDSNNLYRLHDLHTPS